jgi:hypothetical protein
MQNNSFTAPEHFRTSWDYLHETAIARCGLTDFGEDDYSVGLSILLQSLDIDPHFTPVGREMAWDTIVAYLTARLYAAENWKRYPEWETFQLKAPILICGHPRTGTTVLHKLMSADPQFQGIQNWLTKAPQPRPPREAWASHPAFQRAVKLLANQHDASPEIALAHHVVADEVDEENEIQSGTFASNIFASIWYSAGYDAWWATRSERPDVLREFKILKLIGCHEPEKPFLLKNPASIGQLDYWFEHVPDVRIIQTHRDPLKAVPSIASTIHFYKRAHEGDGAELTRKLLGPREMEKWAAMTDRGIATRKRQAAREHQFFDLHHADLHVRPMQMIERIYDHFGLTLSAEAEKAIADRIVKNPEGHGLHNYTMESFALSPSMILDRHAEYIEKFGRGR